MFWQQEPLEAAQPGWDTGMSRAGSRVWGAPQAAAPAVPRGPSWKVLFALSTTRLHHCINTAKELKIVNINKKQSVRASGLTPGQHCRPGLCLHPPGLPGGGTSTSPMPHGLPQQPDLLCFGSGRGSGAAGDQ